MRKITLLLLSIVLVSSTVFAGGYQVRLQGNKQNGFGLVGTPLSWGASSMFYNPGALSFMKDKMHFEVGASGVMANGSFQQAGSSIVEDTDNPLGTPFYVYGAGKINEMITVGLAIYTPFGSSAKWQDDWSGKFLIQNISLKAIFIQPTISFNINDKFGIGAGFVYTTGGVEINKALNYGSNSTVNLDAKASGMGFNLGLFYKASDKLSLGLNYRSKINMKVEGGDAIFTVPSSLNYLIPATNTFDTELPLPGNLDFGVAFQATDKLLIALELDWVMWSTYDTLSFTFHENGDLLSSNNPREYKDSFIPRIGIQYDMMENLQLRAGAYYDTSPTNSEYFTPETVSLNTFAYTLGLSYSPIDMLSIDLSFLQLFGQKSEMEYAPDNFKGTYQTITYIPGLGVSLRF